MAMAAGMATLDELERRGTFDALRKAARDLTLGIDRTMRSHRLSAHVPTVGTVFSILFGDRTPRNYRDTLAADNAKRESLDAGLLARGIFVKPGKPFYLSTAHNAGAIQATLDAFDRVVSGLA